MIRRVNIKDFWDLKKLRMVGIVDSNNFWLFKLTNFLLEAVFLTDLWMIIGLSEYYLFVDRDEEEEMVLGCIGILGKKLIYDCVVSRDYRGKNVMVFLVDHAVKKICSDGFVPELDCIPELINYYVRLGFVVVKKGRHDVKMRWKK